MERLRCPFESALNPATEAAHRHTSQWAQHFGLVTSARTRSQLVDERFTWLVGHFYPRAETRELELISDFTSWLFWHDDVCDETRLGRDPAAIGRQFDRLIGILTRNDPARPGQPFDHALADLRDRFEVAAPSRGWLARVIHSIQQYFEACVWEADNRQRGRVPSVGAFIPMRRFAGGMYIYLDFVELAAHEELPLVARGHQEVVRLRESTMNVACWHNDLFSLGKELAQGDVHNLVVVLAREKATSIAEATDLAIGYCNKEVVHYQRAARRLPALGDAVAPLLASYRRSLQALMRGNLDWSLATGRYLGGSGPGTEGA